MGPLGTVSKFVAESLRGMKGVVASSSMGWGVARFIVLPRVLLSWSWEKTPGSGCSACLASAWKASGGSGLLYMAQREIFYA